MRHTPASLAFVSLAALSACGGGGGGGGGGPGTAPTVVSTTPANGATGVATSSPLTVTFSQTMDCTTITASTFGAAVGGVAIPGTVACSGATATFTPTAALIAGTSYAAAVLAGVKDPTGLALAATYSWSFATDTTPTVVSTTPANGATGVSVSSVLSVTFSQAMDCSTITAATLGASVGGVAVPGAVTCSGATATFTPSASLTAGTSYAAAVQASVKDPTGLALAATYSWSFATAATGAPTVVSTTPAAGETGVSISVVLIVTFSEAMDCSTITSSTFGVFSGGTPVGGSVECNGNLATFAPTAALSPSVTYTAAMQAGVKSSLGAALATTFSWSFTTAVAAACTGDSGSLYIADFGNNRLVRTDDMCGDNWTTISVLPGMGGELGDGEDVFVDSAGKIYVADTFNNRIVRMDDMAGTNFVTFGTDGTGVNQFSAPRSVFVDAGGHIYVTDGFNFARIVRFDDMTGTGWTTYPPASSMTTPFHELWGLFVDATNHIYVTDNDGDNFMVARVVRIDDMTGSNFTSIGTYGTGTNQFSDPWGLFVDATSHIYVADKSNARVVRMNDMAGTGWTAFGTQGSGTDQFFGPVGVFVDNPTGRIYVMDFGGAAEGFGANNRVVRMDDFTGTNWTTLGTQGDGVKEFYEATSVWLH
jgi:hypothetical protein